VAGAVNQIIYKDASNVATGSDNLKYTDTTNIFALGGTNGRMELNGTTSNIVNFNTGGVAAPTFTTRSTGTKIVLFPNVSGSSVDYGFGIENNTLWSSVSGSGQQFKWYAGTTNIATLSGTGDLNIAGITTSKILVASKLGYSTDGFAKSVFGNGWALAAPASTTYYKLAILPVSSGGSLDHLTIEGTLGGWTIATTTPFKIIFSNRDATSTTVNYKYESYGAIRTDVKIIAVYVSGTVEIWAQHAATPQFTKLTYSITNSFQATVIADPVATTTAPVGTIVFDSSSSTYTPRFLLGDQILSKITAQFFANKNSSSQLNIRNSSTGTDASSDFVACTNDGSDILNNITMGVHNSAYSSPSWTLSGPRDGYLYTSDGNLSIGAASAKYVSFFTGGTALANERMRISSTGLVGIGTNNPTVALQLSPLASISNQGTTSLLPTTVGAAFTVAQFVYKPTSGNTSYLRIKATRNIAASTWESSTTRLVQVIDVTEQGYIEYNPNGSTSGMAFGQGTTEWARFLSNGRLGIGSANPQKRLDIGGGSGYLRLGEVYPGYNGINLNNSLVDSEYNFISSPSDASLFINRPTGASIKFRMNNVDQMVLNSSGNLGIGAINSGQAAKLEVNGGSTANITPEITITGNGAIEFHNTLTNSAYNSIVQANDKAIIFNNGVNNGNFCIAPWNDIATTGIRIIGSNGRVGIGIANPSTALHVNGDVTATNFLGRAKSATYLNGNTSAIYYPNINNRANVNSGFAQTSNVSTTNGWPVTATNGYCHLITSVHDNDANYYAMQLASPFFDDGVNGGQRLFFRSVQSGTTTAGTAWTEVTMFAKDTTLLFYQTAAPTGWTKVTTHNDKALRVVNGNGGGSGGTNTFSSTFTSNRAVPLLEHGHTITDKQHSHLIYGKSESFGTGVSDQNAGDGTNITWNTSSQFTGINATNNNGTANASMNFAVQYIDVILCKKN
jgi:hypothetical protein